MATIRKRKRVKKDVWVVDYRDAAGIRRWATCRTRREAEDIRADKVKESRQDSPSPDQDIVLADYATRWLARVAVDLKPKTASGYEQALRLHVLPVLGHLKVRKVRRRLIKDLLTQKRVEGLSKNTVRLIRATLSALLTDCVDDEIVQANPALQLNRKKRKRGDAPTKGERRQAIKAMTREQLFRFLSVAAQVAPRLFALFLFLARSGARLGEGLALQWPDLNFRDRQIQIERALSAGREDTPKSDEGRSVDMSQQLARTLQRLHVERKAETLRCGWREMPPWVFCSKVGTRLDHTNVEKAFKRVLKAAGLPLHFTPHSLRHTFASTLLQQGVSPVYVQRQLGHASIQLTVDTYGRWLPMGNRATVDRLDDGSQMVAKTPEAAEAAPKVLDSLVSRAGVEPATY